MTKAQKVIIEIININSTVVSYLNFLQVSEMKVEYVVQTLYEFHLNDTSHELPNGDNNTELTSTIERILHLTERTEFKHFYLACECITRILLLKHKKANPEPEIKKLYANFKRLVFTDYTKSVNNIVNIQFYKLMKI